MPRVTSSFHGRQQLIARTSRSAEQGNMAIAAIVPLSLL
jgi:hypothetical protein